MFFIVALLIWAGMHVYVLTRLSSLPFIARHVPLWVIVVVGTFLATSYILARTLEHFGFDSVSHLLEYIGADWVGVLFLAFMGFLAADLITGFGRLMPSATPTVRGMALIVVIALAAISFVQAWRAPVVTEYEVAMPGLPAAADGTVLVVASDMHLGAMLGHRWAAQRTAEFNALKPDIIVLAGDIFEGERRTHAGWLPVLQRIQAPHGVFVVTGNHEYYAGAGPILDLFRQAGFRVLRDESAEVLPGLVIAGVDDVAFRHRNKNEAIAAVNRAMANRPQGAVVFVSHTPVYAEQAAQAGANLMLSGHTHAGQIWPFNYFVRAAFPRVNGRFDVNGMTAIIGRGTGTWGPRMRLWKRSELVKITLRSAA